MTPEDRGILGIRDRMLERSLPHSADAEQTVIGSCILDNALVGEAATALAKEDFYPRANQYTWGAVLRLHARGAPIDPVTIGEELRRDGVLEMVGGVAEIAGMTTGLPFVKSLAPYFDIIKRHSLARRGVRMCAKVESDFLEGETDPYEVLDELERLTAQLRGSVGAGGPRSYGDIWLAFQERQKKLAAGQVGAIPFCNLPELNALCGGGVYDQELVGVAALPKKGKSAFMKQVVDFNAGGPQPVGCLVFSREMNEVAVMSRSIAAETWRRAQRGDEPIPASLLRKAYALDTTRKRRVWEAGQIAAGWPVWVDTSTSSVAEIYTRTKDWINRTWLEWCKTHYGEKWQERHPYFLVLLDYVQLLKGGKERYGTQAEEFRDIWRTLRDMTMDLDARVIALAQFNREAYKGTRPRFNQIEGSGEAEKAVNIGIVLDTPEEEMKPEKVQREGGVYVDFQREGPAGVVDVTFDTRTLEFYPRAAEAAGFNE
jgi:replicative DNA helicase